MFRRLVLVKGTKISALTIVSEGRARRATCQVRLKTQLAPDMWSPEESVETGGLGRYSLQQNNKSPRLKAYRSVRGALLDGHPCRCASTNEPRGPPRGNKDSDSSARVPAFRNTRRGAKQQPVPELHSYMPHFSVTDSLSLRFGSVKQIQSGGLLYGSAGQSAVFGALKPIRLCYI